MVTKIDITVILNLHAEDLLLKPTLRSLDKCFSVAQANNLIIELVCVQNSATRLTKRIFSEHKFSSLFVTKVVETDNLSLGEARNIGIENANGEYIWTADGDDLVSENALIELYKVANSCNGPSAVFPEFLIEFGGSQAIFKYSEDVEYLDYLFANPFISRIFIKKDILTKFPYRSLQRKGLYAFEDWDINNRLRAKNVSFKVAPNTVIFYRKRGNSLLQKIVQNSSGQVSNSEIFDPEDVVGNYIKNKSRYFYKLIRRRLFAGAGEKYLPDNLKTIVKNSAIIEPDINVKTVFSTPILPVLTERSLRLGINLSKLYILAGRKKFTDIVILPFLKAGGGEKYIVSILRAINEIDSNARMLVLTGEDCGYHHYKNLLPPDSVFIDIRNFCSDCNTDEIELLAFRLAINFADQHSRFHCKSSLFANRFIEKYAAIIKSESHLIYYYRFSDSVYFYDGEYFSDSWGLNFIRENLKNISYIVSDSEYQIKRDYTLLGECEKNKLLRNLCELPISNHYFPGDVKFLWASRIAFEKRISILPVIAKLIDDAQLNCSIDVFGEGNVSDVNDLLEKLRPFKTINYKGSFSSFNKIPIDKYSCLIYTSLNDGVPNVIVEAMSQGLPVIAPCVGGIVALVSEDNGFIIENDPDDRDMASKYIEVIKRILKHEVDLPSKSIKCTEKIKLHHAPEVFNSNVKSLYFNTKISINDVEQEYR